MENMIVFILTFVVSAASDAKCLVKVANDVKLKEIIGYTIQEVDKVSDSSVEQFNIMSFDKTICKTSEFLKLARHLENSKYGWQDPPTVEKIRDYSGTFHKDYSFDFFGNKNVFTEKKLETYIRSITGGYIGVWKYMYYYNSDGSTNSETGAILFSEKFKIAYKVYFLTLP